jgi:hypothetical protein
MERGSPPLVFHVYFFCAPPLALPKWNFTFDTHQIGGRGRNKKGGLQRSESIVKGTIFRTITIVFF